jgi:hypothetical protein
MGSHLGLPNRHSAAWRMEFGITKSLQGFHPNWHHANVNIRTEHQPLVKAEAWKCPFPPLFSKAWCITFAPSHDRSPFHVRCFLSQSSPHTKNAAQCSPLSMPLEWGLHASDDRSMCVLPSWPWSKSLGWLDLGHLWLIHQSTLPIIATGKSLSWNNTNNFRKLMSFLKKAKKEHSVQGSSQCLTGGQIRPDRGNNIRAGAFVSRAGRARGDLCQLP